MSFLNDVKEFFAPVKDFFTPVAKSAGNVVSDVAGQVTNKVVDIAGDANASQYLSPEALQSMINQLSLAEKSAAQTQYERSQASAERAMQFEAEQAELNRLFQQQSAEKAMQFEANENAIARKFSERMSNTAYQRAVKDLQKAGLNPILAYTNGSASTPSSSSASGFSSSGSSASGKSASVNKADVSSIAGAVLSYSSNIVSNSAKLLSAVGSIIPG